MEILKCGVAVIGTDTHHKEWIKQTGKLIHDPWFANQVCQHVQYNDVVVDIGANIGTISRAILDAGATLWAFEPNPEAVECLSYNCPEAIIRQVALSDKKERGALLVNQNAGACSVVDGDEFDCHTLDEYNLFPTVIKIDAEGSELKILKGAQETIKLCQPVIILEVNSHALKQHGTSEKELLSYIESMGYVWRFLQPDVELGCPQYDIECLPIK